MRLHLSVAATLIVHSSAGAAPLAAPVTNGTTTDGDPAVVAILRGGGPVCTGTLIAPRVVLSAAHCVRDGDRFAVVFGADPATDPLVQVDEVRVHPGFDRETLTDDIALFVLAEASAVPPIARPVPGALAAVLDGQEVRLVGFGYASLDDRLQTKREGHSIIESSTEVALRLTPSPAQPCLGDSGGPVLAMVGGVEVLAATVSWGDPDCTSFAYAWRTDGGDAFVDEQLATIDDTTPPPPPGDGDDTGGCSSSAPPSPWLIAIVLLGYARASRRRNNSSIEPRTSSTRWT